MFPNLGFFEKFQKYQIQQIKSSKQDFNIILIGILLFLHIEYKYLYYRSYISQFIDFYSIPSHTK